MKGIFLVASLILLPSLVLSKTEHGNESTEENQNQGTQAGHADGEAPPPTKFKTISDKIGAEVEGPKRTEAMLKEIDSLSNTDREALQKELENPSNDDAKKMKAALEASQLDDEKLTEELGKLDWTKKDQDVEKKEALQAKLKSNVSNELKDDKLKEKFGKLSASQQRKVYQGLRTIKNSKDLNDKQKEALTKYLAEGGDGKAAMGELVINAIRNKEMNTAFRDVFGALGDQAGMKKMMRLNLHAEATKVATKKFTALYDEEGTSSSAFVDGSSGKVFLVQSEEDYKAQLKNLKAAKTPQEREKVWADIRKSQLRMIEQNAAPLTGSPGYSEYHFHSVDSRQYVFLKSDRTGFVEADSTPYKLPENLTSFVGKKGKVQASTFEARLWNGKQVEKAKITGFDVMLNDAQNDPKAPQKAVQYSLVYDWNKQRYQFFSNKEPASAPTNPDKLFHDSVDDSGYMEYVALKAQKENMVRLRSGSDYYDMKKVESGRVDLVPLKRKVKVTPRIICRT